MSNNTDSATIRLLRAYWETNRRDSWMNLNHSLSQLLSCAIRSQLQIAEGDYDLICEEFRYRFWGGTSENGHHLGEGHYGLACIWHRPAAIEYERRFARKPFILRAKRLSCGSLIQTGKNTWRITGWNPGSMERPGHFA